MQRRAQTTLALTLGLGLFAAPSASATGTGATALTPEIASSDDVNLAKAPKRKSRRQRKKEEAEAKKAAEEAAAKEAAAAEAKAAEEKAAAEAKAAEEAAAKKAAEEKAAAEAAAEKAELERRKTDAAARAALEGAGLDARVRFLTDSLARTLKRLPGDFRDQTYSVLPFEEVGEETQSRQLGKVVSDLVITNFARDHRFDLTERSQLAAIGAEQALGQLGALEDGQAVEVGKLAAARAIVLGTVADTGEGFVVTARALDTTTGKLLSAEKVTLPKEELIAFSADAVVLRSKAGAAFRSAVAPGWGQAYNRQPFKAALVGGGVGALVVTAAAVAGFGALNAYSYDCWKQCNGNGPLPLNPDSIKSNEEQANMLRGLRDTANASYAISGVVLGVAAAVWGIGVADAYFSGTDVDSLDEAMTDY